MNRVHRISRRISMVPGTASYVLALLLIAAMSITIHFVLEFAIKEQQSSALVVNMAGRQRMLSQRISRYAEELQHTEDGARIRQINAELTAALTLMRDAHQILEYGSEELGITPPLTPEIRKIYKDPPNELDERIGEFIEQAELLTNPGLARDTRTQLVTSILEAAHTPLLQALDNAVVQYQVDSEKANHRLQLILRGALSAILITLLLEATLIFRPLMSRLFRQSREHTELIHQLKDNFRQQAQALTLAESAVNNTDDAIMITDDDGKIIKVNEAFSRLTGYRPQEVLGEQSSIIFAHSPTNDAESHLHQHMLEKEGGWSGDQWFRRKGGERFPASVTINSVKLNPVTRQCITIFRDISGRYYHEQKIHRMAYCDALTDLPNRYALNEELEKLLARSEQDNVTFTLIFIDLDRFKHINDKWGHNIGDKLLQIIARRLTSISRDTDLVCRMGGDEFVVLQIPTANEEQLTGFLNRMRETIHSPVNIEGHSMNVTASIGISNFPENGMTSSKLITVADSAMIAAKRHGGNAFHFFNQDVTHKMERQIQLEGWLTEALDKGELSLYYQPQLSLDTHKLVGMEALLRWHHPQGGDIGPNEFIPVAENGQLIMELGNWALDAAFRQAKQWADYRCPISVNISIKQLQRNILISRLRVLKEQYCIDPALITLELTETSLMEDMEQTREVLELIHEEGFNIAIDDFGTGHSSLSSLRILHADILKIDRTFIQTMAEHHQDSDITRAIIELGHMLNKQVIAEGVENQRQEDMLQQFGCDSVQGFLYAHAIPATQMEQMLRNQ